MFVNNLLLDICTNPDVLKTFLFIKIIIKYIFIFLPIGLIIIIMFDFSKGVVAKSTNDTKKILNIVIKRLIYCALAFFVPTIVNMLMTLLNDTIINLNVDYNSCFVSEKELEERISYYEKKQELELEKQQKEQEKLINETREYLNNQSKEIMNSFSTTIPYGNNNVSIGEYILDWDDVTKISNVSVQDLEKGLNSYNSKSKLFTKYANTYISLERKNHINVFFVLGINSLESGWLGSSVTKKCNNIAGVKYAHQSGAAECTEAGRSPEGGYYAKWMTIDSFLNYYVPWLKKAYLTEGGDYYKGKRPEDVVINYNAGSQSWVRDVKSIGNGLFKASVK